MLVLEGFWGLGVGGWGLGFGLWTNKRNSLLHASLGKEEEVWNGFELTLRKIVVVLG